MPAYAIVLRAQFHSGHVATPDHARLRSFADDDLLELLRRSKAALRADGVGERLSLWNRFAADLSRGIDSVLRLERGDNLRDGNLELRQLVGPHPQAHGILSGAEDLNRADSLHARQRIGQVDIGVVRQEPVVMGALGRVEGNQHQRGQRRLLDGDAVIGDIHGELRRRLRLAALGENQIRVGIRGHVEIDDHPHLPVGGGVERIHVVHVVDAAHLLLDRSSDRLLDGLGVGPDVDCRRTWNLGRRNGGELGDGADRRRPPCRRGSP